MPSASQAHRQIAVGTPLPDGRDMNVVGVVPITFIAMALDTAEPRRFDWGVPINGPAPLAEGAEVRGCFAIDALGEAAKNEGLSPARYVAYLVVDGVVIVPEKFEILPL
jgi:hypothetical protein